MKQKEYKQKQTENADYVNNMTRHKNTLYQHNPY